MKRPARVAMAGRSFRVLGFWVLGLRGLGFRVLGFRVLFRD